jgi:hypothetical protein
LRGWKGTLAARTLDRIIGEFAARGVEFIALAEAMRHPVNAGMPPVHDAFTNHLQRFALAVGAEKPDISLDLLFEVVNACPVEDMDTFPFYDEKVLKPIADRVGSPYIWEWS